MSKHIASVLCLICSIGLFIALQGCSRFSAPVSQTIDPMMEQREAIALYHDAWQTVFNEFVDPSLNGQNWYRWKDRYNNTIKTKEDAYVAIQTMLASLNDVYTQFLNPHRAADRNMHIDSRLSGVGIQMAQKGNQVLVISPLEGSPARKAGIMPLDRITRINDEPVAHF